MGDSMQKKNRLFFPNYFGEKSRHVETLSTLFLSLASGRKIYATGWRLLPIRMLDPRSSTFCWSSSSWIFSLSPYMRSLRGPIWNLGRNHSNGSQMQIINEFRSMTTICFRAESLACVDTKILFRRIVFSDSEAS